VETYLVTGCTFNVNIPFSKKCDRPFKPAQNMHTWSRLLRVSPLVASLSCNGPPPWPYEGYAALPYSPLPAAEDTA